MDTKSIKQQITDIAIRRGSLTTRDWKCLHPESANSVGRCPNFDTACDVCSDWYRYWDLIEQIRIATESDRVAELVNSTSSAKAKARANVPKDSCLYGWFKHLVDSGDMLGELFIDDNDKTHKFMIVPIRE